VEEEKKRLVLIDGNAILHRAYHALPALTTRNGELVNAVYGFASMLLRIFDELHPEYLAVCFDTAGPNFRHQQFIGYKANRPMMDNELAGQIEKVHELVRAFNIPILEVNGYEADDVIAALAKQAMDLNNESRIMNKKKKEKIDHNSKFIIHNSNIEVLIVTGDKDLMQLVDERTKLYMPTKGLSEAQIVDREKVIEKMGIPPEKIIDYKGLVGDPSDNYPGVPGIGPKTAIKLLEKFGTIEKIYKKISVSDEKIREFGETTVNKLAEGAESAVLSKKLATILTDVPVKLSFKESVVRDFDKEKVLAFFKELGFRSLVARIEGNPPSSRQGGTSARQVKDERQGCLF